MKKINYSELFQYSDLPKIIKQSKTKKLKTKKEVLREFNLEKWGSVLNKLKSDDNITLTNIDMLMEEFNKDSAFFYNKQFFVGTGKEIFDTHIDLYVNILSDYINDSSCLVELGAGYGSKILNISKKTDFNHLPLYATEYTLNGCESIKVLAQRMNKDIDVGLCDFKELKMDAMNIPEGGIVFTSYALHYANVLSNDFVDFINKLKPRVVIHFEPIYEYHKNDEYGKMCKKYIEINDYNLNMGSVFNQKMETEQINLIEKKNVLGGNPFLPLSIVKWTSIDKNLNNIYIK
tara:strand:- start:285 stop:1154 length:870 start_codon:yes stop_codon:yes gene_type:complete